MTAQHQIPDPDESSVPELEDDQSVPPRPEEEIADALRAIPDVEDHSRVHPGRPSDRVAPDAAGKE